MSGALVGKDLLVLRRDTLLRVLFVVTVVLVISSLLTGLQRERVYDKEKSGALEADRSVWMNQGERNPHSAAHTSRYAFRPASPLAMLDPGTSDFSGLAIWMAAHSQDPAVFRRAEDSGELSRYMQLTPAFLLLTVAPLLVFLMLFASIAGEREDGTLRQLLATGVNARQFFKGKLGAGLRMTLVAFVAVFVPVAAISALVSPAAFGADALIRLLILFVVYAVYLAIFVAIAVAVSAWFRSRQSAFLALTCVWALTAVVMPQLATDVATSLHPQPDARVASEQLGMASEAFYESPGQAERVEAEVLEQYGVDSVEELPIEYDAYLLQVSEDMSEPEFDRFYASLDSQYAAQESVIRSSSLLTPTLAATNLSRGIAGTDRIHQREFTRAAESHRREMIQMLNEDYMYNSAGAGYAYTAGADVWAKFEDLDYALPAMSRTGVAYLADALLLVAWLAAALWFAYWSVLRAVVGEEGAV